MTKKNKNTGSTNAESKKAKAANKPVKPHPTLALDSPITDIKGIGEVRAEQLARLNLLTINDLIHHRPRRHEDRTTITPIGQAEEGTYITVSGTIKSVQQKKNRRWQKRLEVIINDETGSLTAVFFRQAYLKEQFKRGDTAILSGKVGAYRGLQMASPDFETIAAKGEDDDNNGENEEPLNTGRIIPIYPSTDGLAQTALRKWINIALNTCLKYIEDPFDEDMLSQWALMDKQVALRELHWPSTQEKVEYARRRLAFEEFFLFQLAVAQKRQRYQLRISGRKFKVTAAIDKRIRQRFPFAFTAAQDRVITEIKSDLAQPRPMNRLLQGDVGSGKTAVALYAMLSAIANKAQALIMAPTEILAQQHAITIGEYLKDTDIKIVLLCGSSTAKQKKELKAQIASGEGHLIIGTHALIQETVTFKDLGFVVIDEQHKFGVAQRANLLHKGNNADLLLMSATPIPRSLAMTIFGDLDVSIIDELPPGRLPVTTRLVPEPKRDTAYTFMREKMQTGCQVYAVYPLIEESETLDLNNATDMANSFATQIFPEFTVALLHGKLKPDQKNQIMAAFNKGDIDLLVSTVVIEVGVNVPNANIMVIEEAQRFGLAQIHQLRGRIGRGGDKAYCLLFAREGSKTSRERLSVLTKSQDGFEIAEADLQIRGPGEFTGTRQHGLPPFSFGDVVDDFNLMEEARDASQTLIKADPQLDKHLSLKTGLARFNEFKLLMEF